MALKPCPECNAEVSDKAASCPRCGAPISAPPPVQQVQVVAYRPEKSKSVAVLLAMLLGGLGFHKFYLDKPVAGVLYLVFCWTFIPSIIGFLEGLAYLSHSDEAFQKRYVKARA